VTLVREKLDSLEAEIAALEELSVSTDFSP
jgi:hypothetical protein